MGTWQLQVRHDSATEWHVAYNGDLDGGAVTRVCAEEDPHETMKFGCLAIDPAARQVTVGDREVTLTKKEFGVLVVLASAPTRVFIYSELLRLVWGDPQPYRRRTLGSHVSKLRSKLRSAGCDSVIVNTRGVGWKLWDRAQLTAVPPLPPGATAV
jgi:DNA-binding response OmpR family regulator